MSDNRNDLFVSLYETFMALERKWSNEWNHLNELGLSKTHIQMLEMLDREGARRPSSLAEQLKITTGGVTVLTQKLLKDGLIQKTQSERDRRATNLAITEAGQSILEIARTQIDQHMKKVFGELSNDEIEALESLFSKCLVRNKR